MSSPSTRCAYVSEVETVQLLREAHGRQLALAFGPHGVWLETEPRTGRAVSAWASPLLALWRGETFDDGGGI